MFHTSHKFHKLKCITQDDVPTRSKIQQHLGTSLAQIIFDYSHHEAIKLLDSIPSERFLQQSYCTADDQLKTDATRTWLEKQEILKSQMHHNILALGKDKLKKFQTEIEAVTQTKLRDKFAEKCHIFEAEKRLAIKHNANKIHAKYEEYLKSVQQELEEKLQIERENENAKHNKELQKAIVKTQIETTHDVVRRIRPQMHYIVTSLYNDLEESCRAQKEKMIADFNKIMREQYLKLDARIKQVERKKMEELHVQRNEFEIQNAMSIIYILCMERLRTNSQMNVIHKHFEEKTIFLHKLIAKQDEIINIMKKRITEYHNKNIMLQEKVTTITKEFQKFINFAFDAVPEHADFLLPLNLFSAAFFV
nr:PREDICTED: uncharacterized protein LOC105671123 isoform X2 [Linepithema humile]